MPSLGVRLGARVLHQGGIVAYPTEAVWGLGCDPFQPAAVARLLELKRRPARHGLILVAASMEQLGGFLHGLSDTALETLRATWPGPCTWLVPDNGHAPPWISGRFSSVALRVSAHPIVAALCRAHGGALVSTSANPHGRPPARDALQARRFFAQRVDYYLAGGVGGAHNPTEIRDLRSGRVLRHG